MASKTRDTAGSGADAVITRIRDINDRIVDSARRGGEASLEAYERLLKTVAEAQAAAGDRGADWVRALGQAQAKFARELADSLPAAARSLVEHAADLTGKATAQARRVPGATQAEGEARGAVAREQDLPIRNYDELNADEVIHRLGRLSQPELRKVDAYERKHRNRKTIHDKIASLTG